MISRKYIPKNKSMCLDPFTSLFMGAMGENRLCCVSLNPITGDEKGQHPQKIYPKDIHNDIWTSDYFKDIRQKMINGEKIEECQRCYDIEEAGGSSKRMFSNESICTLDKDFSINVDTGNNKHTPVFLDIRPSNLCNLKCRMCYSDSSSLIGKEISNNEELTDIMPYLQDFGTSNWFDSDIMQEQLRQIMPNIRRINLLGGETSIIKNVHKLLKWCIDEGYNDQLIIDIATNMTNTNDDFFNLLKQFKCVNLYISIDGVDVVTEYIRFPSKWSIIERNINRCLTMDIPDGNILNIHTLCTANIYNILYLHDVISWIYTVPDPLDRFCGLDHNARIFFNIVYHPEHQCINLLPIERRQEVIQKLLEIAEGVGFDEHLIKRSSLSVVINELNDQNVATDENHDLFIKSTKVYDRIRKQSIETTLPELYDIFKEDFEKSEK